MTEYWTFARKSVWLQTLGHALPPEGSSACYAQCCGLLLLRHCLEEAYLFYGMEFGRFKVPQRLSLHFVQWLLPKIWETPPVAGRTCTGRQALDAGCTSPPQVSMQSYCYSFRRCFRPETTIWFQGSSQVGGGAFSLLFYLVLCRCGKRVATTRQCLNNDVNASAPFVQLHGCRFVARVSCGIQHSTVGALCGSDVLSPFRGAKASRAWHRLRGRRFRKV